MDVTESMRQRWEGIDFPPPHNNEHPDREGLLRNRQNYAAMIENIDRQVGRFIDCVKDRGELNNTLIIYTSDHGEMLGDHGRWSKSIWFHPATAVPLIVSGPGIQHGVVSEALVSLHDLTATIIEYSGASPMPNMDSLSLKDLLEGNRTTHRDHITSGLDDWRMVFDGRYKLVVQEGHEPVLFDMDQDSHEDDNIAMLQPSTVGRLLRLI
jgi:arylsulfatase A-like enzyme